MCLFCLKPDSFWHTPHHRCHLFKHALFLFLGRFGLLIGCLAFSTPHFDVECATRIERNLFCGPIVEVVLLGMRYPQILPCPLHICRANKVVKSSVFDHG